MFVAFNIIAQYNATVMSGAYDEYMEHAERGLRDIPNTLVCSSHIEDAAIKRHINGEGEKGTCSYCNRLKSVVSLEKLMYFLTDGIRHFYTDPANFMIYESAEGGYQGNVYSGFEILNEHVELDITNTELFNDIEASLDGTTPWSNEYEYFDSEADYRMQQWNDFKEVVKTRSRYLFSTQRKFRLGGKSFNAYEVLKELGRISKRQKLIKKIPSGTELFRCRQHEKADDVKTVTDITSPPDSAAIFPNRMSPAGISMFYSAFDAETAVKETVDFTDKKNKYYTIASFKTKHDLCVLDLSGVKMPSIFDQRQWKNYYTISFLVSFIRDFTKSIEKDGRVHIEYVPTQIVTEYFRYSVKVGSSSIAGIIYPSSKNIGKKACVLFFDHFKSQKRLDFDATSIKTQTLR